MKTIPKRDEFTTGQLVFTAFRPCRNESSTGGNLMTEVDAQTISTDLRPSRSSLKIVDPQPSIDRAVHRFRKPTLKSHLFANQKFSLRQPAAVREPQSASSRDDAGARTASRCRRALVLHKQRTTHKTWGAVSTRPTKAEGDHHARGGNDFHPTRTTLCGRRVARVATLAYFLEAWPWTVRPLRGKNGVSVSERRTIPGTQEIIQGL